MGDSNSGQGGSAMGEGAAEKNAMRREASPLAGIRLPVPKSASEWWRNAHKGRKAIFDIIDKVIDLEALVSVVVETDSKDTIRERLMDLLRAEHYQFAQWLSTIWFLADETNAYLTEDPGWIVITNLISERRFIGGKTSLVPIDEIFNGTSKLLDIVNKDSLIDKDEISLRELAQGALLVGDSPELLSDHDYDRDLEMESARRRRKM